MSGQIDGNDNIIDTGMDHSLVQNETEQYPLSAYNPTWGWRLIAPLTTTGIDILNYYSFYTYNETVTADQIEGVINWTDPHTTLTSETTSYDDWAKDTGILDNIMEAYLVQFSYTKTVGLFYFLLPTAMGVMLDIHL